MYYFWSTCSMIVHLLLKHPILTVALGLAGAAAFVKPIVGNYSSVANLESSAVFQEKIKEVNVSAGKTIDGAERYFQAILKVGGNDPAGLNRKALDDICGKIPDCPLNYDQILKNPGESVRFARLYFYELVNKYGAVETAVTAYHYGPTTVDKILKEGGKPPGDYLEKVKKHL